MNINKKEKYSPVPLIHNREELLYYVKDYVVINDILTDDETYNKYLKNLSNAIKGSFCIRECRECPIKFKFYKNDEEIHTLELRHFFINVILWNPFIEIHDIYGILDKSFIFDCKHNVVDIESFIDTKIIEVLRDYLVKPTTINFRLSDMTYNLRCISIDYSLILGLNFDVLTFIDQYENNEEIKNMMEIEFDEHKQPCEIEEELSRLQKREIEIYTSQEDNPIGVILNAGTGIKHKQFAEFTISQGLKPSIDGETIPITINNSILIRGSSTPSYLYLGGLGSRKSLIMNKKVMGKAGYFGKMTALLARTLSMSTEIHDCGSKHLVAYKISSKAHLTKLSGKYYKLNMNDHGYKLLKKSDVDLIGKTIYCRSAVTCALGDKVCPICLGKIAEINHDIADGISVYSSEEISKVVNQMILSTKHLLTTVSEEIKFNKDFYKFFNLVTGEITPNVLNNKYVDYIENYAIYIPESSINKNEQQDYDSLYNTSISNGVFYIRNIKDSSVEDIEIRAESGNELYLSEVCIELMNLHKDKLIHFSDLDDNIKLFEVTIMNKELTKPLYELMALLNKKSTEFSDCKDITSINEFCQRLLDILIDSGIKANVVAGELITNRLIRSMEDEYERPDFNDEYLDPYSIIPIKMALIKNKSPMIGIAFEDIKKQLLSTDLYDKRNSESYIDPLFWTEIPTDNIKHYKDLAPRMR